MPNKGLTSTRLAPVSPAKAFQMSCNAAELPLGKSRQQPECSVSESWGLHRTGNHRAPDFPSPQRYSRACPVTGDGASGQRTAEARAGSAAGNGISRISASSITGNILVFFDPTKDLPEVVGYLEIAVRQPTPEPSSEPASPPAGMSVGQPIGTLFCNLLGSIFSHEASPAAVTEEIRQRPPNGHAPETPSRRWHVISAADAVSFWRTSESNGLAAIEAARRLKQYGANALPAPEERPPWAMLREQFLSLPALLLIGSAALSLVTGGVVSRTQL